MSLMCDECGLPMVPFGGEDICMGHDDSDDYESEEEPECRGEPRVPS